jgi:hypothetical protein
MKLQPPMHVMDTNLKLTRFMSYKYIISQGFTIFLFLTFPTYIFSESISLKYYCIFFLFLTKLLILPSKSPHFIQRGFFTSTSYRSPDILGTIYYYHKYR